MVEWFTTSFSEPPPSKCFSQYISGADFQLGGKGHHSYSSLKKFFVGECPKKGPSRVIPMRCLCTLTTKE